MKRKFRLKKDTPEFRAGAIFIKHSRKKNIWYELEDFEFCLESKKIQKKHGARVFSDEIVENTPDWFEEIKEEEKYKRLEWLQSQIDAHSDALTTQHLKLDKIKDDIQKIKEEEPLDEQVMRQDLLKYQQDNLDYKSHINSIKSLVNQLNNYKYCENKNYAAEIILRELKHITDKY